MSRPDVTAIEIALLVLAAVTGIITMARADPRVSRTLLGWAARRCFDTDELRRRFAEEWLADLDDVPGPASKLAHTLGVLLLAAAPIWARSRWRRSPLARWLDRATTRSRAGLAGIDAGSGSVLARAGAAALVLAATGLVAVRAAESTLRFVHAPSAASGAPGVTRMSQDNSANTYFKVPYRWHQLTPMQVTAALHSYGGVPAGVWTSAFDAGRTASPDNFLSFATTSPFVFAEVGQLNLTATASMSYNGLEDLFLPVSSTVRQQIPAGSLLTNFKQIGYQPLAHGQGVHGVRVTFQYTDQAATGARLTDTFDEVALTNATGTEVYLLVLHCTSSCYSQDQKAINDVMTSFTVRSS